jgi:hypothetical protein
MAQDFDIKANIINEDFRGPTYGPSSQLQQTVRSAAGRTIRVGIPVPKTCIDARMPRAEPCDVWFTGSFPGGRHLLLEAMSATGEPPTRAEPAATNAGDLVLNCRRACARAGVCLDAA